MMKIVLLMSIFVSTIYADITKKEMEKYFNISREKNTYVVVQLLLQNYLLLMTNKLEEKYRLELSIEINTFISNPIYQDIYKNTFLSLDPATYKKLISFYNTNIGKKYAKAIRKMCLTEKDIRDKYTQLKRNKQISKYRRELVDGLIKELNSLEIKINKEHDLFLIRATKIMGINSNLKKLTQKHLEVFRIQQEEYEPIFMGVLLIDFTDKELVRLLEFSQSKLLQIEEEYHINAFYNLYKKEVSPIQKITYKLVMIPLCKDFSIYDRYPEGCKKEWLKKK